jgi:hypothetical protein
VNFTLTVNTLLTSRILSHAASPFFTESLLLIDEPESAVNKARQLLCGSPGTVESSLGICTGITATGSATGTYSGVAPRANVFQGRTSAGSNSVSWLGIPFDAPGSGTHIFRFTNIRVNANSFAAGAAAGASPLLVSISISGATSVPLSNALVTVAFVQSGVAFSTRTADNTSVLTTTETVPNCTMTRIATFRFQENFASAFRPRTSAPFVDRDTSPSPANQNIPGQTVNSESGFRNGAFLNDASHGNVSIAGLADYGTRLRAHITSIPAGVTVLVDPVNIGASPTLTARLVSSENGPFSAFPAPASTAPLSAVPVVNGTVTLDWEVLAANPSAIDSFDFGIYFESAPPGTGNVTVTGGLGPPLPTATVDAILIPTFALPAESTTPFVSLSLLHGCGTLVVTPPSLRFTVPPGSPPSTQTVQITSPGGQPQTIFAYTLSGGNWLSVSKNAFAAQDTISVTANVAGLPAGTYSGLLLATAAAAPPLMVGVTLVVGGPVVVVSPAALSFSWNAASATPPPAATLSISSAGGPVSYTAVPFTTGTNWLAIAPSNGTTPGTISVTASPANLLPGAYTGTITVTPAGTPPIVVNVSLTVAPPPGPFRVSPFTLAFSGSPGATNIAPQNVVVINSGSAAAFSVAVQPGAAWLIANPLSGTSPAQFTVSALATGLAAGKYTGRLLVTAVSGPSFSAAVDVTLTLATVTTTPVLISNTDVSLSVRPAPVSPPSSKTISVSSSDGSPVRFSTAVQILSPPNVNWLSVAQKDPVTPTQLTLTLNPQGLGLGSFLAIVRLISAGGAASLTAHATADNCPPVISVTGDTAPAPFGVSVNSLAFSDAKPDGTFLVSNPGQGVSFGAATYACWLNLSPNTARTPQIISAHASPAGLGPDVYKSWIAIFDSGGTANGATVPVSFTTGGGNATTGGTKPLLVCPDCGNGISITYRKGDPPVSQRLQLQSTTGTPLNFTTRVSSGANWAFLSRRKNREKERYTGGQVRGRRRPSSSTEQPEIPMITEKATDRSLVD